MSKTQEIMNGIGEGIEESLKTLFGRKLGFALFVFPLNDPEAAGNYVSNADRLDMVKALKFIIEHLDEGVVIPLLLEDWN